MSDNKASSAFIIFPNQLFEDIAHLKEYKHVYLIEEPLYFYDNVTRPFSINKIKLTYIIACMKAYEKYMRSHNISVIYIQYDDVSKHQFKYEQIVMYNPIDEDLVEKYKRIVGNNLVLLDTPMFLLTNKDLFEFQSLHRGDIFRHSSFYAFIRRKLKILEAQKNTDTENRIPLPTNFKLKETVPNYDNSITREFYKHAITKINSHKQFKNNIGVAENVTAWPITFKDAKTHFETFLKQRFFNFGKYQDAISADNLILFHSAISPMLNNGLLTPRYVVDKTLQYAKQNKISINSLEGFIRQVIGWREYMRFIYATKYHEIIKANYFKNTKTFKESQKWYKGELGIPIIDAEIKKAVEYGYAHHIVRLMIFLNFMILTRIHPSMIYQWFMEVVAMDAYEWVMKSNIYCMGYFYTKAMVKPYVSTSNYLTKMSTYKSKEPIWDALFYAFLYDNKHRLNAGSSIYLNNLRYFESLTKQQQHELLSTARNYISRLTKNMGRSR